MQTDSQLVERIRISHADEAHTLARPTEEPPVTPARFGRNIKKVRPFLFILFSQKSNQTIKKDFEIWNN